MLLKRLFFWRHQPRPSTSDIAHGARITFFGGKGGVGKTTCAAAWALQHARSEYRILLISTDPAHSLGDVLGRKLSNDPQSITSDLDALELSPELALADYIAEVKSHLRELSSPELRAAAERQADLAAAAPGAQESALFEAIVRCILELGPGRGLRQPFRRGFIRTRHGPRHAVHHHRFAWATVLRLDFRSHRQLRHRFRSVRPALRSSVHRSVSTATSPLSRAVRPG